MANELWGWREHDDGCSFCTKAFSTTALAEPEPSLPESDLARLVGGINEIMAFVDETIAETHLRASLSEMKDSIAEILLALYYEDRQ